MSQENFEQWQRNLDAKIKEVEAACHTFITSTPGQYTYVIEHHARTHGRARMEIQNLLAMYGGGNHPPEIKNLVDEIEYLHEHRDSPRALPDVLQAINRLKLIPQTGTKFVSFHDIFEKYREDNELNDLVDQLVQTIEKVLAEDDGELSSRVERDLTRLLDQIRNRPKLSTYEIGAWAELVGRFLLELYGQKQGVPGLSMIVDGIKLSKKIFDNVVEKYQDSQSEYVRLIGLKSAPEKFSSLPQLTDAAIQAAESGLKHSDQPLGLPYPEQNPTP